MDTRILEGTSIREHVFKMTTYFEVLEVLGANIDGEVQVDMILHSLHASFTQFKMDFKVNKIFFSMSELMSSLQEMKEIVKLELDGDKPSSSETKPKGISLEKMKQCSKIGEPNPIIGKKARKGKGKTNAQPKGKCFYCGVKGH